MTNIVDALKGYITPSLLSKAVDVVGEDKSSIHKGITGLIPTILGGLIQKSSNTSNFGSIFNMLKDSKNESYLDNLGDLIGGGNLAKDDPKDIAGNLMSKLFGNKVGGILDLVSSVAGLKRSSSSTLLGMVGPLVMSYLGRKIRKEGLSALGLSKFLQGQSTNVANALPAGMGDLMGFSAGSNIPEESTTSSDGSNKWLWPLLLLAALAGAFYFMRGCDAPTAPDVNLDAAKETVENAADAVADAAGDAADAVADAAGDATDAVADAAENVAGFFKKTLACGIEMNIPEDGIEAQVVAFIDDENKAIDKTTWFNFDRLTFETGEATLNMTKSAEQLDNIGEIMKCYPNTKIKIGGYTDNTGGADVNMKLSQDRANAVMAALVEEGVAADRMEAEGYGSAHPVASNDTEEGRAQNRRIALRLTAK